MLEENFNDLDNDFITLWSSYILDETEDYTNLIKSLIEMLAEKGQINAIQSWYLIKDQEEKNEKIDKIVDKYKSGNFNEEHAKANRLYDESKSQLKSLHKSIYTLVKYKVRKDKQELIEQYKSTPYAEQVRKVVETAYLAGKATNSCFINERLLEIISNNELIIDENVCAINKKKFSNSIRHDLEARLKKNPEDPITLFSLGKNLKFFGTDEMDEDNGQYILEDLSKRPLTFTKTNYKKVNIKASKDDSFNQ